MADWTIERLRPTHERAGFACGKPVLDIFLQSLVSQYEKRRLGRTFVATRPADLKVAGYYTLAAGSCDPGALPEAERKKLPKHAVPLIHLGRLAVDQGARGLRLGETLLFHALRTALELVEKLGAFVVDVYALDEDARSFYVKYGFSPLQDDPFHLFLPLKTIQALFDAD